MLFLSAYCTGRDASDAWKSPTLFEAWVVVSYTKPLKVRLPGQVVMNEYQKPNAHGKKCALEPRTVFFIASDVNAKHINSG